MLDFEGVQKHGLAAREATEFPRDCQSSGTQIPSSSTISVWGRGEAGGTAQVARHTVTYEQQTNAAHPRILTVTHFSKMKPGDHSQPSCKRLEQDPDNGGQQKNPQQLEKNKMR